MDGAIPTSVMISCEPFNRGAELSVSAAALWHGALGTRHSTLPSGSSARLPSGKVLQLSLRFGYVAAQLSESGINPVDLTLMAF